MKSGSDQRWDFIWRTPARILSFSCLVAIAVTVLLQPLKIGMVQDFFAIFAFLCVSLAFILEVYPRFKKSRKR